MSEWHLTDDDLHRAEWFRWDASVADDRPDLAEAVAAFDAFSERNPSAAQHVTEWFVAHAQVQRACVTRIMVSEGRVAAFYSLSSAEMSIGATQNLTEMGVFREPGPPDSFRVGSSHVEFIARDRRSPPGTGKFALRHAFGVATITAGMQGNLALTLDPADHATEAMWRAQGFRNTERTLTGGLRRLYHPIFGPAYGPLAALRPND